MSDTTAHPGVRSGSHQALRRTTAAKFFAEAERRFGPDRMAWRFVCPCCGHEATPRDWKDAGAGEGEVAFSCVGRHSSAPVRDAFAQSGKGPCNYAGGGLFKLNPMIVVDHEGKEHNVFALAGEPFPASLESVPA